MLLYGFVWFGRNSEAEVKTINEWKRLWSQEWKRLWSDVALCSESCVALCSALCAALCAANFEKFGQDCGI